MENNIADFEIRTLFFQLFVVLYQYGNIKQIEVD